MVVIHFLDHHLALYFQQLEDDPKKYDEYRSQLADVYGRLSLDWQKQLIDDRIAELDAREESWLTDETDETVVDDGTGETDQKTADVGEEAKKAFDWNRLANAGMGLLAGAMGRKHMKEALKDIPIEEGPKLDSAWSAHMSRMRELSQSGLTSEEKAAAQADLSKNYNLGVRNVMRAAGGSRAAFLANAGVLNANRVEGLLKLSAADAAMQRENMKNYGAALQYQNTYNQRTGEIDRKMAYDEAGRKSNLHGQLGNELIKTAIQSVNYAMKRQNESSLMDAYSKLFEQQNISGDISQADADLDRSSIKS